MKNIHSIEFYTGSKEELLPGFEKDFPYIASRAELDKYIGHYVPWHWHKTVELFYMESGSIEYDTPGGKLLFPAGSGGIVNSNVLHMTKAISQKEKNIQLLHIFDVSLLAGEQGSRIEQKYIAPIITAPQIEVIPLFPGNAEEERILKLLAASFRLSSDEFGYEIKLRETLTEIWLMLFELSRPMREKKGEHNKSNDKIKLMMIYIHEHYREKISIPELAAAAYLSERECYRVFHDCLHMTPVEYIKAYRLQAACQMLAKGQEAVTVISHECGLGSSSYFGKVFREYTHCSPTEYRRKWQNSDRQGQKRNIFLFLLHYNDTCKVNPSFTGGECKVVKLNILNMKNFLDTVNSCSGKVNMLCPDGKKQNINGEEKIQGSLWRQYSQNKNCLRLVLEVPNPTDYMNIVSYYAGDC